MPKLAITLIVGNLSKLRRDIMGQIDDLRAAIAQVGTDLAEAVARVQAKLDEAGEPDADLSADIAELGSIGTRLDALAADAPPEEPPVEPPA